MDFKALNPWRKTPTLYKWDDNWRPAIGHFSVTDNATIWEWICPDDYYCIVRNFGFNWVDSGGAGTTSFDLAQLRGSQLVYNLLHPARSQLFNGEVVTFVYGWIHFVGLLVGTLVHSIGDRLYFIPGDRLRLTLISTKVSPRIEDNYINLQAYYF